MMTSIQEIEEFIDAHFTVEWHKKRAIKQIALAQIEPVSEFEM